MISRSGVVILIMNCYIRFSSSNSSSSSSSSSSRSSNNIAAISVIRFFWLVVETSCTYRHNFRGVWGQDPTFEF